MADTRDALGYITLDATRLAAIQRWEARQGEPYEGFRLLPPETASARVRRQYAEARRLVQEAVR